MVGTDEAVAVDVDIVTDLVDSITDTDDSIVIDVDIVSGVADSITDTMLPGIQPRYMIYGYDNQRGEINVANLWCHIQYVSHVNRGL